VTPARVVAGARVATEPPAVRGRHIMAIAKVIELTAESHDSFEDAVRQGIAKAAETVTHIKSAWVKDQQVLVQDNEVTSFRVTMKVTFMVS
jgi:flavin-binding protein dodecin